MTEHHYCSCGFAAASVGELIDHLHEAFSLASDTAPDGMQHAEAARDEAASGDGLIACLCGYPAVSLDDLDRHILAAYTASDATAPDGIKHVPESADLDRAPTCALASLECRTSPVWSAYRNGEARRAHGLLGHLYRDARGPADN